MNKIIVITGPTASGKTELAIKLATAIDAEIICADSRIVYKNLDIVSAKPTIEERKGIKHHLIDILEPSKEFSAGDFVLHAKNSIKEIKKRNKNIIICGGTWFYIKNLLGDEILLDCPSDMELRRELAKSESNILWDKLNLIDKKRAEKIHPNNKDKIIRAIEMCEYLKKPVSEIKRIKKNEFQSAWFMPETERQELYKKINKRVDIMLEMGLYNEWEKNSKKYPDSSILKNTIGYSEFFNLKEGVYSDYKEAIEKIKQHTRNFAKRQLTYFRNHKEIQLIKNYDEILRIIQ